jgi:hypothetical protein
MAAALPGRTSFCIADAMVSENLRRPLKLRRFSWPRFHRSGSVCEDSPSACQTFRPTEAAKRETPMQIDPVAAKQDRAAAAVERVDARADAAAYAAAQSGLARDQRVEEAKASAAARPTVAEKRAADPALNPPPPRAASGSKILDVLA